MYPSPLILDRHFFTKVELNSHPEGQVGTINLLHSDGQIGTDEREPRRFQLTYKLKITSPPDKQSTYTGEIHAVGLFRVVEGYPLEKAGDLVSAYGTSLLFAAIRELLLNLTSRGPFPPLMLSSFNFMPPPQKTEQAPLPAKKEEAVAS
jgi:preprotein translocase subunit SecB